MYAVGRLGSYITRGVYTVSGPFHPFGGAVDIVVVQQQDGSLKSSPWYVRFGKFQGVLKAKERIVDINVNGVDADFHMYLDPRGEAYFLREVDSEEATDAAWSPSSSGEDIDRDKNMAKSKSMNYDFDQCNSLIDVSNGQVLSRNNSRRSRILGFVLGRNSMKEHSLSKEESERAEIAADLLEMKWSTNLSTRTNKNDSKDSIDSRESSKDNGEIMGGRLESSMVLHEEHFVNNLEGPGVDNKVIHSVENLVSKEEISRIELNDPNEPNEQEPRLETAEEPLKIVSESHTEVIEVSNQQGDVSIEVASCSSVSVPICQTEDNKHTGQLDETNEIRSEIHKTVVEEKFVFSDLDLKPSVNNPDQEIRSRSISEVDQVRSELTGLKYYPQERFKGDNIEGMKGKIRRYPSNVDIPRRCEVREEALGRQAKSLPNMWCHFDESDQEIHDDLPFYSPVAKLRSSKWDLLRDDASRLKTNLEKEHQFSDPQSADNLSKDLKDGGGPPDIVDGTGGSWSLWPFTRLVSKSITQKEEDCKKDSDVDCGLEMDGEKEGSLPQSNKMHTRAITPTPEQLASLNLAEGHNTVAFTFSTSVLGSQKVDARIYLWRWDTRIVISDVDGTITKSDVLGQFMPLVGRDWSHIGVTQLFSAIKENGYQMLYLSARAISQASITRQFLFNLMQDGKALPDGPVVISPDGLFPSLFREVIRRAPHEFKIACLEDIKACFPSDRNPFYAGFGNRDTDEFSYLKIGIAKGKIFIINPKGEVVINRCIDSKSYTSLHALVNGIFPPISVHEEEDFNSWNFWKLPPPTIE